MTCPCLRAPPLLLRAIPILRMSGRYSSQTVSSTFTASKPFSAGIGIASEAYGQAAAALSSNLVILRIMLGVVQDLI